MFKFEDYLRFPNSLIIIIFLISICALWFAYRSYKISEKSYKNQRETEKKHREREINFREKEKKNKFYEAKHSILRTKHAGENIVRNINKHLLHHSMTKTNKNSLFTIRAEMVQTIVSIDKLLEKMSVENLSHKFMGEIEKFADEIEDKGDEIVEIFEDNNLKFSHLSGV